MNKIDFASPKNREFFPQEHQPLQAVSVFHIVGTIASLFLTAGIWLIGAPASWKDQVLDVLPEFISLRLDPRRVFVLRILELGPDQRGSVLKYALERIAPAMDQQRRQKLIQMVSNEGRISSLSRNMLESITPEMHSDSGIYTFDAIAAISAQERCSVVTYSDQLLTDQSSGYFRKVFIEALLLVRSQEREEVMRNVLKLISPLMNAQDRVSMIQAVNRISKNQRDEVVSASLHLITLNMSAFERSAILEVLSSISIHEREEVALEAMRLIRLDIGYFSRTSILRALSEVKSQERVDIVDLALHAINKRSNYRTITNIVQALNSVRPEERAEMMRNALLLIDPEREAQEGDAIIRLIARLPASERNIVANLAHNAITRQMNHLSRIEVIKAIISAPSHERADVMQYAMVLINHRMNGFDRAMIIQNVANTPFGLRAHYVEQRMQGRYAPVVQNARQAANQGVNVHEGNRDLRTKEAIQKIREHQGKITKNQIDRAVQEFTEYLKGCKIDSEIKKLAYRALLIPKAINEEFGALIDHEDFSILGLMTSGQEVIARLWIYASTLNEPEQTNAKDSMIYALQDSYEMQARVCNQGKTQRLVIGVLQGRLSGVDVEEIQEIKVSTHVAIQMFFSYSENTKITDYAALINAANQFCDENSAVNRADFLSEIRAYARIQNIEG
ncbi:MAG: hypothetical protein FJZ56_04720 [Chlamydiae bacterium]|nr:hypothetical protein [Chlamydiota bacterium]